MKIIIYKIILSILSIYMFSGCTKESGNGNGDGATTGEVMFWIASDLGCGNIRVTCNGISKTISSYHTGGAPSCGTDGTATFTLDPGTYSYTTSCSGLSGNGTVTVTAGNCSTIQVTGNGGGSGGGGGTSGCSSGWSPNLIQIVNTQWITDSWCSSTNNRILKLLVKNISSQFVFAYIGVEEPSGQYSCAYYGLQPGETTYAYNCSLSGRYKWNARLGSSTHCSTCPW